MGIVLSGPGIYVPPTVLTNQHLVDLRDEKTKQRVLDTSEEWMFTRSGIKERRISLDEDVKTLGIRAVNDLETVLARKLNPHEIRFATNRHRDGEFPCYASTIAAAIGANEVIMQDNLAGCTGLVHAIRDAYNAIKSGEIDSSLVGGVEGLSDFANYADRSTCFLFGDGAGWYLLERREGKEGIIANVLGGTPDKGSKDWPFGHLAIRKTLGKKLKKTPEGFETYDATDYFLMMNGQEVFKFATEVMRKAVHEVLDRSHRYTLPDVDVIIPHGANMRIIDAANKGLVKKGFRGVIYTNMERFGNTSTASIPISTAGAIQEGVIRDGSLVINVAFGAGFTYGANLYRASIERKVA
jgi:3-oxoacyl-[acyl-carrier-protein] synthase-3